MPRVIASLAMFILCLVPVTTGANSTTQPTTQPADQEIARLQNRIDELERQNRALVSICNRQQAELNKRQLEESIRQLPDVKINPRIDSKPPDTWVPFDFNGGTFYVVPLTFNKAPTTVPSTSSQSRNPQSRAPMMRPAGNLIDDRR